MRIQELSRQSGVPAKTIRYYESIGIMPPPHRGPNNYREYTPAAVERLRFIVSARSLGFSLSEIGEFLEAREVGMLPCKRILDSFDKRIMDIDRRIAELLALRDTLTQIQRHGADIPVDRRCDDDCLGYTVRTSVPGQI